MAASSSSAAVVPEHEANCSVRYREERLADVKIMISKVKALFEEAQ